MAPEKLESKLKAVYPDCAVVVVDMTGNGSNFEVRISEASFKELSRVQQHQKVMAVFSDELASGEIHALAIKTIQL